MKQTVKIYLQYFLLYFRSLHEYRANWIFALVRVPMALVLTWYLWKTLYAHSGSLQSTYSFNQIFLYFITLQWIGFCSGSDLSEKMATDIRTGALSIFLSRPVRYLPAQFSGYLAQACLGFATSLVPFSLGYHHLNGQWDIQPLFWLTILGAMIVHFLFEAFFAVFGFWIARVFGLKFLILTVLNLAGGKLIPISLFPKWFQDLSWLSPVRVILYEPANLLMHPSWGQGVRVLGTQLVWILLLSAIVAWLWRRGLSLYEASG